MIIVTVGIIAPGYDWYELTGVTYQPRCVVSEQGLIAEKPVDGQPEYSCRFHRE
jgi:hypothetical protein